MEWNNRIVEMKMMNPAELTANPLNWRIHPEEQEVVMDSMLNDVGWVQGIIFNRRTGRIVDGHLRVSIALRKGMDQVPVNVVDLSEEEEKRVLAELDPIGDLARRSQENIEELLVDVAKNWEGHDVMSIAEAVSYIPLADEDFTSRNEVKDSDLPGVEDEAATEEAEMSDIDANLYCALPHGYDIGVGPCPVGCVYCFVRAGTAMQATRGTIRRVKQQQIERVFQAVRKDKGIFQTGICIEPALPALRENLDYLCKRCEKFDVPLSIHTKLPSRIMDLPIDYKKLTVKVAFSFFDEEVAKQVEPHANTITERIAAMNELADRGASVILRWQPMVLGCRDEFEEVISQVKAVRVICEELRVSATGRKFYYDRLNPFIEGGLDGYFQRWGTGKMGGALHWYDYDKAKLRGEFEWLRERAHKHGMKFGICSGESGTYNVDLNDDCYCCKVDAHSSGEHDKDAICSMHSSGTLAQLLSPVLQSTREWGPREWTLMVARIGYVNHVNTKPAMLANKKE